jgi:glycosyltransferase involved in cell wall biosynthesis
MKKIMIVANIVPDGGITTWLNSILGKLAESCHIYLLVREMTPKLERSGILKHKNVEWGIASIFSKRKLFATFQLRQIIREFQPDLIICHDFFVTLSPAIARLLSPRIIPIVIVVHGVASQFNIRLAIKQKVLFQVFRLLLHEYDKLVAVSPYVHDYLMHETLSKLSLHMIPNGIDTSNLVKAKHEYTHDFKNIVFIGRLSREKGPDIFLKVAKELEKLPIKFHLIGDGLMKSSLEEFALKFGLQQKIIFHGWLDNIFPILKQMDALLVTSRTEGLPFAVLEAFKCQIPVFSLKVGGVPYVLQDGENGYLLDSIEEMVKLIRKIVSGEDYDLKQKIMNASSFLENEFSSVVMNQRFLNLLEIK